MPVSCHFNFHVLFPAFLTKICEVKYNKHTNSLKVSTARNDKRNRRTSACVVITGAGQPGVQSECVETRPCENTVALTMRETRNSNFDGVFPCRVKNISEKILHVFLKRLPSDFILNSVCKFCTTFHSLFSSSVQNPVTQFRSPKESFTSTSDVPLLVSLKRGKIPTTVQQSSSSGHGVDWRTGVDFHNFCRVIQHESGHLGFVVGSSTVRWVTPIRLSVGWSPD